MWLNYSKTDEDIYYKLKDKTDFAIKNSVKNEEYLKNISQDNLIYLNEPYTNMYKLINDIKENII